MPLAQSKRNCLVQMYPPNRECVNSSTMLFWMKKSRHTNFSLARWQPKRRGCMFREDIGFSTEEEAAQVYPDVYEEKNCVDA